MKILLRGYYGWGNLGDDVLMTVVYNWLRKQFPDAQIDVFSGFTPNNAACRPPYLQYHQYIHKLLPEKPRIVDWAVKEHYDLLVQGGGGIHFDHTHGGMAYTVANSLIKTVGAGAVTAAEKLIRKAAGKQLNISFDKKIGIGIGVGDFTPDGRSFVQHASKIGEYDFIWVRDDLSVSWLKSMKFKGQVIRASDLAFYTEAWLPRQLPAQQPNTIGFVGLVKESLGPQELHLQRETIKALKRAGLHISVYLLQEVLDEPLVSFFEEVCPVKLWRPQHQTMEAYLADFGSNQLIISGRAHGVILGACMGVPALTIETSSKLREVSLMFPQTSRLITPSATPDNLVDLIKGEFQKLTDTRIALRKEVNVNQEKVHHAFAATASVLNIRTNA